MQCFVNETLDATHPSKVAEVITCYIHHLLNQSTYQVLPSKTLGANKTQRNCDDLPKDRHGCVVMLLQLVCRPPFVINSFMNVQARSTTVPLGTSGVFLRSAGLSVCHLIIFKGTENFPGHFSSQRISAPFLRTFCQSSKRQPRWPPRVPKVSHNKF